MGEVLQRYLSPRSGDLLSRGTAPLLELLHEEKVSGWQNTILVREGKVAHEKDCWKLQLKNGKLQENVLESLAGDAILHFVPKPD